MTFIHTIHDNIGMKVKTRTEVILEILRKSNGAASAAQLGAIHISGGHIRHALDKGLIERVARGVYALPSVFEDDFFCLQSRLKRGVFFCETALFLHGLSDRTPDRFRMAFPKGYNTSRVDPRVRPTRMEADLHALGVATILSPGGHPIAVFDVERTLCDILRPVSHVGVDEVSQAFNRYVRRRTKDLHLLSQYAKRLGVTPRLRAYLEVLT